jgi:hypothetical protein
MSTERLPRQGRTQRANQQQEASRYRLPRDQSNQPRRRARENTLRRHNQPADRNLRRHEGTELTDLRRTYSTQESSSSRSRRHQQQAGESSRPQQDTDLPQGSLGRSFSQRIARSVPAPEPVVVNAEPQYREYILPDRPYIQTPSPGGQNPVRTTPERRQPSGSAGRGLESAHAPADSSLTERRQQHGNAMPAPLSSCRPQGRVLVPPPRPSQMQQRSPLSASRFAEAHGNRIPSPMSPDEVMNPQLSGRYLAGQETAVRSASLGTFRTQQAPQQPAERPLSESESSNRSSRGSGVMRSLQEHLNSAIRGLREQDSTESFVCQTAREVERSSPRGSRRLC